MDIKDKIETECTLKCQRFKMQESNRLRECASFELLRFRVSASPQPAFPPRDRHKFQMQLFARNVSSFFK